MDLPFRYMPKKAVLEATGIGSNSSLYAAIQNPEIRFPPPDKIGARSLWKSTSIAEWLTAQAAKAEAERAERAKIAQDKARHMRSMVKRPTARKPRKRSQESGAAAPASEQRKAA